MMIAFAIVGVVLTVAGLVLIRNRYRSLVREKQAITSDLLGLTDGSTISPQNINELIDRVAATAETSQATLPAQVLRLLRHYQSRPNGHCSGRTNYCWTKRFGRRDSLRGQFQ